MAFLLSTPFQHDPTEQTLHGSQTQSDPVSEITETTTSDPAQPVRATVLDKLLSIETLTERIAGNFAVTSRFAEAMSRQQAAQNSAIDKLLNLTTAPDRIYDGLTRASRFEISFTSGFTKAIGIQQATHASALDNLAAIGTYTDRIYDGFAKTSRIAEAVSRISETPIRLLNSFSSTIGKSYSFEALEKFCSITRWIEGLGPAVVWEARAALASYQRGDTGPMRRFIHTHLRLRPPTEDHEQALALALLEGSWKQGIDLQDPKEVLTALRRLAREGDYEERFHQVAGFRIGRLDTGFERRSPVPGPDDLAIARILPWAEQFDDRNVRYATRRLKDEQQTVARAWAENPDLDWLQAPQLVGHEAHIGTQVRRKLRGLGNQINERAARVQGEIA